TMRVGGESGKVRGGGWWTGILVGSVGGRMLPLKMVRQVGSENRTHCWLLAPVPHAMSVTDSFGAMVMKALTPSIKSAPFGRMVAMLTFWRSTRVSRKSLPERLVLNGGRVRVTLPKKQLMRLS